MKKPTGASPSSDDAHKHLDAAFAGLSPGLSLRVRRVFRKHGSGADADANASIDEFRIPRVMLLGRRGAGKSSLFNALFGQKLQEIGHVTSQTGETAWKTLQVGDRSIEVLDSRGLQEGTRPEEEDGAETADESIRRSILNKRPDLILFLAKAKEVDSAILEDLSAFEDILRRVSDTKTCPFPIIGVVTQVDELDPPDILDLPTDDKEKNRNIEYATEHLRYQLRARPYLEKRILDVVPVVAYAEYDKEGEIRAAEDARWNIDRLLEVMLAHLPKQVKVAEEKDRRQTAVAVVNISTGVCGTIALAPIPLADMPVLTGIQIAMVMAVARLSGEDATPKSVGKFLAACGLTTLVAFAGRELARAALRFIPGAGSGASATIAAVTTKTIGDAAIGYYFDGLTTQEIREQLRSLRLRKKKA